MSRTKPATQSGGKSAGKTAGKTRPTAGKKVVANKPLPRNNNSNDSSHSSDEVVIATASQEVRRPQAGPTGKRPTNSDKRVPAKTVPTTRQHAALPQEEEDVDNDDQSGGEEQGEDVDKDSRIRLLKSTEEQDNLTTSGELSSSENFIVNYGPDEKSFVNPGNLHMVQAKRKFSGLIRRGTKSWKVKFRRSQRIRVLPNELYLNRDQIQDLTADSLGDADWWYAEIVDCCVLDNGDDTHTGFLKVRWFYTPQHITSEDYGIPSFRDDEKLGPYLANYQCDEDELIFSDHTDYINMESFSAFADGLRHKIELRGLEVPDHIRVQSETEQAKWHKQRMKTKKNGKKASSHWVMDVTQEKARWIIHPPPADDNPRSSSNGHTGARRNGKGKGKTARMH